MSGVAEPIGHEAVRAMLRAYALGSSAGSGLHHAWLFAGPPGVGKFQVARWWASILKCPDHGNCQPTCESCRLIAGGVHPDVFETGPAPKDKKALQVADVEIERKKSVSIEESRALIQRLSLRPAKPGPRIAIMREAGTMQAPAQNALLKLLEEPPGSAVIILVTDNIGSMITTVRSRCRHLAFATLSRDEVADVLVRLGRPREEAEAAAACARGSVSRGLAFDVEGLAERESLLLAWEGARRNHSEIDSVVQALVAHKDDAYYLAELLQWQMTKVEACLGHPVAEPSGELRRLLDQGRAHETFALIEEAERIQTTIGEIARNVNPRLAIRDLLMNVRA